MLFCHGTTPPQDLVGWTKDKSEVEVVDLVLKLREKLVRKTGVTFSQYKRKLQQ